MGSYEPLGEFLGHLDGDYWRPTFHELERLLGRDLPATARKRRGWWTEGGAAHAKAWLDAGWRASDVNLEKETVTFRRGAAESAESPPAAAPAPQLRQRALQLAQEKPLLTISATAAGAFVAGMVLGLIIGEEA